MNPPLPRVRLLPIELGLAVVDPPPSAWTPPSGCQWGDCSAFAENVFTPTLNLYRRAPREAPWLGYFAADDRGQIVGSGGFVDAPNRDREVEIAYHTFPPFEKQGFGTAIANALIRIALDASPSVSVIAHTLPEPGPSPQILKRTGFKHWGIYHHPEDGEVWRWVLVSTFSPVEINTRPSPDPG